MTKMLYITSLSGKRINGFMRSSIYAAHRAEVDFTMACNMDMADKDGYKEDCDAYDIKTVHVGFDRNPWSLKNFSAYKQLKNIVKNEHYDLVHCNTPIGGVLGRIAAKKYRKIGLKVIYTAHGFHFYKGAPIKNWILYYPVEWFLAHWTDVLITINEEDYELAKKHMHAKRVEYVPGVGIDLQKFAPNQLPQEDKDRLRESIGVGREDKLLLSVGELIRRKNHESVIRALAELDDPKLKYRICGCGELESYLQNLIEELHLTDRVQLLGYRNDISELCECADLFVFPSFQEGLPVALMEAIASKVPVICSDIRGNTDLVGQQELFDCTDTDGIAKKIMESLQNDHTEEIERNYRNLKKYDLATVISDMETLYSRGGGVRHLYEIYKQQLLRKSIGIPADAAFLLSVGELNANKNHSVVIRAVAKLQNPSIHYAIAGVGELHDDLLNLAAELGVADRVHLLGYRGDVVDLYQAADLYIHPSKREGLPVALMEAIASKTSVICSKIRGNVDLVNKDATFQPDNISEIREKIVEYLATDTTRKIEDNFLILQNYDIDHVIRRMKEIYCFSK